MKTFRPFLALIALLAISLPSFAAEPPNFLQTKPTASAPSLDDWLYLGGDTNSVRKLSPLYFASTQKQYANPSWITSLSGAKLMELTVASTALAQSGATVGQVMGWTGSSWGPVNQTGGGGGGSSSFSALSGLPTDNSLLSAALSAKVNAGIFTSAGFTVSTGVFLGRVTAGTGAPEELSSSQVKTALALNLVNNTSDASKPISTATQAALDFRLNYSASQSLNSAQMVQGKANLGVARDIVLSTVLGVGTADLSGTTISGADVTATIQGILNTSTASSPLRLVVDSAYCITGLTVKSYTDIVILPGCGFAQLPNSDKPMISNATLTAGGGTSSQRDFSINIYGGGILNGNGPNQAAANAEQGWTTVFRLAGVENGVVRHLIIRNPRTFAVLVGNAENLKFDNITVDKGTGGSNRDGIKIMGPSRNISIDNSTFNTDDDAISVCSNDLISQTSPSIPFPVYGPFIASGGDIYDVTGQNNEFLGGYGIRMLSTTNRIDRIRFTGTRGTVSAHVLLIDNYSEAPQLASLPNWGNYGEIIFENSTVERTGTTYKNSCLFVSGKVDHLVLRNITRPYNATDVSWLLLQGAHLKILDIDGYTDYDPVARPAGSHIRNIRSYVDRVRVTNSRVDSFGPSASAALIDAFSGGGYGTVELDGITANGINNVLNIGGTVRRVVAGTIKHMGQSTAGTLVNSGGVNALTTHVGSYVGSTLFTETSGTFGTKTGAGTGAATAGALPTVYGLSLARWTGTNGTAIASYTPDIGPVFAATSGAWEINGSRARTTGTAPGDGRAAAVVDVGVSDNFSISVSVLPGVNTQIAGLILRYTDASNYDFIGVSSSFGIQIYRNIAGTVTQQGSSVSLSGQGAQFTAGMPYRFIVEVVGSSYKVYPLGGVQPFIQALSGAGTGTKVGLIETNYLGGNHAVFGEFAVNSL